jgi:hypothetical protein
MASVEIAGNVDGNVEKGDVLFDTWIAGAPLMHNRFRST